MPNAEVEVTARRNGCVTGCSAGGAEAGSAAAAEVATNNSRLGRYFMVWLGGQGVRQRRGGPWRRRGGGRRRPDLRVPAARREALVSLAASATPASSWRAKADRHRPRYVEDPSVGVSRERVRRAQ